MSSLDFPKPDQDLYCGIFSQIHVGEKKTHIGDKKLLILYQLPFLSNQKSSNLLTMVQDSPKSPCCPESSSSHYDNMPMQYTAFFMAVKMVIFRLLFFFYIFLVFAQNIDCWYTLEPPH